MTLMLKASQAQKDFADAIPQSLCLCLQPVREEPTIQSLVGGMICTTGIKDLAAGARRRMEAVAVVQWCCFKVGNVINLEDVFIHVKEASMSLASQGTVVCLIPTSPFTL